MKNAFNAYSLVVDHLRELIADALDINRRHIEVISIEKGEKVGFAEYSIKYLIKFNVDGEVHNAIWTVSYWNSGETTENISLTRA